MKEPSPLAMECDRIKVEANVVTSHGPPEDLRNFYSTTYSKFNHFFKSSAVANCSKKQGTGFSKNVVPYVEYFKPVDEDSVGFQIKSPYLTSYKDNYLLRGQNLNSKRQVSVLTDSAYTREKDYGKKDYDPLPKLFQYTEASATRCPQGLQLKPSQMSKGIIPSDSAFTTDVEHIKHLGDPYSRRGGVYGQVGSGKSHCNNNTNNNNSNTNGSSMSNIGYRQKTPPQSSKQWIINMCDNGYSRKAQLFTKMGDGKDHQRLRSSGYFEKTGSPPTSIYLGGGEQYSIGKKEPTGSIRENKPFEFKRDLLAKQRFMTCNDVSFQTSTKYNTSSSSSESNYLRSNGQIGVNISSIPRSGYSLNNKYESRKKLIDELLTMKTRKVVQSRLISR